MTFLEDQRRTSLNATYDTDIATGRADRAGVVVSDAKSALPFKVLTAEESTVRAQRAHKKIALLHHGGGGNLGDGATLESVVANVKLRWPNAELIALSMNPDDTKARHGISVRPLRRDRWRIGYVVGGTKGTPKQTLKALTRRYAAVFFTLKAIRGLVCMPVDGMRELAFLMSSRRFIRSFDLLIVMGGGQLTEKDGPWGFPYTIFKWVAVARSAGVRCIFLNVGAGPLTQRLSKLFARRALLAADYVSLRDEKSQALVRRIGFKGESRVHPNSVYALDVATTNEAPLQVPSRRVVGFSPMPFPDPDPGGGYAAEKDRIFYDGFIGKLADFGSWLVSRSYTIAPFGNDIGVDPQAISDFRDSMASRHGIRAPQCGVYHPINSVNALLVSMSSMDYVLTCRFHGVIFAHLMNKPLLAIAHHPKVAEAMAELGLSSYCVDIRDFDAGMLADRFSSMVMNAEDIKSRMAASLAKNRQQLRSQFDELFK